MSEIDPAGFEHWFGRNTVIALTCPGCGSLRIFPNLLVEAKRENDYDVIQVRPVAVEACCLLGSGRVSGLSSIQLYDEVDEDDGDVYPDES